MFGYSSQEQQGSAPALAQAAEEAESSEFIIWGDSCFAVYDGDDWEVQKFDSSWHCRLDDEADARELIKHLDARDKCLLTRTAPVGTYYYTSPVIKG